MQQEKGCTHQLGASHPLNLLAEFLVVVLQPPGVESGQLAIEASDGGRMRNRCGIKVERRPLLSAK